MTELSFSPEQQAAIDAARARRQTASAAPVAAKFSPEQQAAIDAARKRRESGQQPPGPKPQRISTGMSGRGAVDDAQAAELAAFEAANPKLVGKFNAANKPAAGETVPGVYNGGGGKSGGVPYVVQGYDPTFEKTAPDLAAAKAAGWKPAFEPYVDFGQLPASATESDPQTGETDAGEPLFRTRDGIMYSKPMIYPPDWGGPGTGDRRESKTVGQAVKDVGMGIVSGIKQGVQAPGKALSGEVVTNNDALATAGMVGGGATARMGAPKAAVGTTKAAMKEMGIQPSLGMRGKTAAIASAALEKFLPSAHVIANDATRALGQLSKAYSSVRGKVGEAFSPESAGTQMQKGLRRFVDDFQKKASTLYDKVDSVIPAETAMELGNFVSTLADAKAAFAKNPAMAQKIGLNEWDAIAREAAQAGSSWQAAKDLRSAIGEAIGSVSSGPLSDQGVGRLKSLYGALTKDMESAARAAGAPAYSAWKRANAFYKAGTERIERNLDGLIGKDAASGPSGERAFEAFSAMTKADRATSDVVRMRKIKASMAPETWGSVAGSIFERLGKAKPGAQDAAGDAFSPITFMTEWNKLSKEAKAILVPEEVRGQLNKLVEISGLAKSANLERNFSNTGNAALSGGLGAMLLTEPLTAASAVVGGYGIAQALTNPMFLKALTALDRGTTAPLKAIANGRSAMATAAQAALAALPAGLEEAK